MAKEGTAVLLGAGALAVGAGIWWWTSRAAAAAISGDLVAPIIWYDGLAGWEVLSPGRNVPQGADIYLGIPWQNTSEVDIRGHVALLVTSPVGGAVNLAATENQDRLAPPRDGWIVMFEPFNTSLLGIYTLSFVLSAEGKTLATLTTSVAVT